jgi:hypothetical protein
MSIYKTRLFGRWARGQGLSDSMLCQAVREIIEGLYEAERGGSLLKKRIARPGQGKSGGFRTIVATGECAWCFFLSGFAKSERTSMDDDEVAALKAWAEDMAGDAAARFGGS